MSIPETPLSPADDWAVPVLADQRDDDTYSELVYTIDDLDAEQ